VAMDARHIARALSFSVAMKYDTESDEDDEQEVTAEAAAAAAAAEKAAAASAVAVEDEVELEEPERLHNRNSSIMMDFAAMEQQMASGQRFSLMPPPAPKPPKKQALNEGTIQVCLRIRPPSAKHLF
jgi:hypothetical protein